MGLDGSIVDDDPGQLASSILGSPDVAGESRAIPVVEHDRGNYRFIFVEADAIVTRRIWEAIWVADRRPGISGGHGGGRRVCIQGEQACGLADELLYWIIKTVECQQEPAGLVQDALKITAKVGTALSGSALQERWLTQLFQRGFEGLLAVFQLAACPFGTWKRSDVAAVIKLDGRTG